MDTAITFSSHAFSNPDFFYISSIGITFPSRNFYIDRKHTVEYSFAFIFSGEGTFEVDGKRTIVSAGDTTILPKGLSYRTWSNIQNPQHKIWAIVRGQLCDVLYEQYQLSGKIRFDYARTGSILQKLYNECDKNKFNTDYLAMRGALAMHELFAGIAMSTQSAASQQDGYAIQAKEFIDRNLNNHIRVEDVATAIGISVSHLNRVFTATYRITPSAYYLQCRIDMAQELLLNTSISIKEISRQLGFSSERYFSDCFLKKCGTRPRAYRSSHGIRPQTFMDFED